jgi:hypothetical protein
MNVIVIINAAYTSPPAIVIHVIAGLRRAVEIEHRDASYALVSCVTGYGETFIGK